MLVQLPRATTECEFDLASKPDCQKLARPWIAIEKKELSGQPTPDHISLMARADQVKAKPLRGGPTGPAFDLICARHL
ncbi:hypothetical protein [Bradyrhizobium sp. Tv2a-2]|uniref:hypothetical protein n=1 Tax=Bradyrhizobium sp. Tv2a-2 TaxID=113395 RepID=UPI0004666E09|nr:hypothetical protein [Bradyrhizobium sp. Tv2a-2]